MKKTAMVDVKEILGHGNMTTAYYIARVTGYSPQHINRCLRALFFQGQVAYTLVDHRHNKKRLWCALKDAGFFSQEYVMIEPEYIQEELL